MEFHPTFYYACDYLFMWDLSLTMIVNGATGVHKNMAVYDTL